MNQNKKFYLFFLIACFFQIVSLLWVLWPAVPTPRGEGMSWDAVHTYAESIDNGTVTNWHSALFLYECLGIKYLVYHLSDRVLSGVEVLYVAWILLTTIMLVAIINLLYILGKRSAVWLAVFPCCVLLSFNRADALFPVGLDYYFVCLIWCLISLIVSSWYTRRKRGRIGYIALILVLFIHLVAYRRNVVIFVPFVMGWVLYMTEWFRGLLLRYKTTIFVVACMLFSVFSLTWVDVAFPVTKLHPLTPMMESDVRIAAILRGEKDPVRLHSFRPTKGETAESCISAYWYAMPEDKWDEFCALYVKEWREHTETMFAASVIQRVQFYLGGLNTSGFKAAVEAMYPAVKENENAWKRVVPFVQSPFKRLFCLCLAPICIILYIIAWKFDVMAREACITGFFAGCMSSIYALSYLIVVPTVDARYLAPSYMFALLSTSLLVVSMLVVLVKCVRKKFEFLQN